ncbi:MAG: metallophosphoesterase [Sedimenticolaceae bacterium]
MIKSSPRAKPDLLHRLRRAFSGLNRCRQLKLRDAYRLVGDTVRVPYEGFPMELILGENGKRLRLYPEHPLAGPADDGEPPSFLIEDPDHSAATIGGFLRLEPGERLTLGRDDPEQQAMFNYPESVAPQHLRVIHDDDAVVFEDKTSVGTCIAPALNEEKSERMACLRRIYDIFGGPLKPLPKDEALILIKEANQLMEQEVLRPRDDRGLPGGLLKLPAGPTPIVVADLHALVDNLLVILSHNGFLHALEKGEACLVIIGDAVHSERDGAMDQMDDSILMMDLIFRLKLRFPENLFFIRGNHDSFGEEISKGGVPQGLLWKRALNKTRGKAYRRAMQRYYDLLPYVVVSPDFCAAHAAPPRSKISTDMLVEIHRYPGLVPELLSNRMIRPNRPGGYTKGDIKRFRKSLDLEPDTPFIVGHTPMDLTDTYWLNNGGAANHHVLYSANENWVGLFTRIGGQMWPMKYPAEPLVELVNGFADQAASQEPPRYLASGLSAP